MSAPDPESFGLLGKVAIALTAVAAPIGWLWTKIEKKADKHTVNNQVGEVKAEQQLHREYFKSVFEKMEEHARRDHDTHTQLLTTMSNNHAELLRELGRKADR